MVAKEKKTFVAPLANLHCFSNASSSCLCCRSLALPRREKVFFLGKGGLRKGKFIHPSDAEESSLFLPFLTALEESYKKRGEAQT